MQYVILLEAEGLQLSTASASSLSFSSSLSMLSIDNPSCTEGFFLLLKQLQPHVLQFCV